MSRSSDVKKYALKLALNKDGDPDTDIDDLEQSFYAFISGNVQNTMDAKMKVIEIVTGTRQSIGAGLREAFAIDNTYIPDYANTNVSTVEDIFWSDFIIKRAATGSSDPQVWFRDANIQDTAGAVTGWVNTGGDGAVNDLDFGLGITLSSKYNRKIALSDSTKTNSLRNDIFRVIAGESSLFFVGQCTSIVYPRDVSAPVFRAAIGADTGVGGLSCGVNFFACQTNTFLDSITHVTTVATATLSQAEDIQLGDVVKIIGADQPEYNGFQTVTGVLGLTFTYTMLADPLADATGSLSAKIWRDGIPMWYVDADGTTGTFTAADAVPHVFGILRRADDSGYLSVDGIQQPIAVFGTKDLCTTSLFNFGLNQFGWEGWIGEVVIYNEALSEEAMNGVSMALRAKWGMP